MIAEVIYAEDKDMPEQVEPNEYPYFSFFKSIPPYKYTEYVEAISMFIGFPPIYKENGGKPIYAYEFLKKCEEIFTKEIANSKGPDK